VTPEELRARYEAGHRLTPRQKWDAGITLTHAELDELLVEAKFDEHVLGLLDPEEPRSVEQIAERVRRAPADVLLTLQRLAVDPVWLARQVAGGWVSHDGEEPQDAAALPAIGNAALVRFKPQDAAALAHDGGLGLASAYDRLGALTPPASAAQPLMHLRTEKGNSVEALNAAIVDWGRNFAGLEWYLIVSKLPGLLIEFLCDRYRLLTSGQAGEIVTAHLSTTGNRINIDVPAIHARLAELGVL
jgi:hypothetical protein